MSDKKKPSLSYHSSLITHHFFVKIDQLDSRHRGVEPLVPGFDSRTVNRLFERIGGDDAVEDGNARLHRRVRDAFRDLARNVLEVRRLAADDGSQTDDGVELLRLGEPEREQ